MSRISKYEIARIIGLRAGQLSMGERAHVTDIPENKESDYIFVAALEIKRGLLDADVYRTLPHNKCHVVNLRSVGTDALPDDLDVIVDMMSG